MEMALIIKKLHISFINNGIWQPVVKGIDLKIAEGQMLALVGESGSGKSVTSLSVMNLLSEKKTRIEYQKMMCKTPVSMIFQEPMTSLNPTMRCGKQVLESVLLHNNLNIRDAKEKVLSLFEEVRIDDAQLAFKAYPHQLSGGQKQRIMIAMALARQPKLLIADEPTTALDASVQKTVLELLKKLQKTRNLAILFITHDLNTVRKIADKVAIIYKGEIVEEGSVEKIFNNPENTYTQALLASRPPNNTRPKRLLSVKDFINHTTDTELESVINRKQRHEQIYSAYPLLVVNNISVKYKNITAIDNASFEVYRGETLGLVGESGSGKTTMGRTILKLVKNQSGSIIFDNQNLASLSAKQMLQIRKRIQIIFQDPYSSLNPRIKVGKMLKEVLDVHHIGRKEDRKQSVIDMLHRVGLDVEHYNRYPHQFSGGQRQRIGIARALILNPELVICDESVSALDVSVASQILNLLNALKYEMNFTIIFISHDLNIVRYMSDRIMVMKNGSIVEQNEADSLYSNPQNEYTKSLIAAMT